MEADGAVDAQNAPTVPWKTLCVFHELPQRPFQSNHPRKTPKGPKMALGNPDRPKDQAERQRGFDGNLGVLQLPSARADAHGLPRGDRFRRQPQGDVASLDQCSVVRRPVSDAVFRFVPGMHSRLHVQIMPLRPSRWSGPRRTLVTAHQRHATTGASDARLHVIRPRAVFLARSRHHSKSVSRGSAPAEIGSSSNVAGTSVHSVDRGDDSLISGLLRRICGSLPSNLRGSDALVF